MRNIQEFKKSVSSFRINNFGNIDDRGFYHTGSITILIIVVKNITFIILRITRFVKLPLYKKFFARKKVLNKFSISP